MKYLITGGCGFLGSNIAHKIIAGKDHLIVFDNLFRYGSNQNLEWLQKYGEFDYVHGDIRNINDVTYVIRKYRPDVIYHLAGQVAMTTSLVNPRLDFEINVIGTFNLLEAVRKNLQDTIVIYSSTNKVYGDLEQFAFKETKTRYICEKYPNGFNEQIHLEFHSPYGCSKGAADQYLLDYSRCYNIKSVVLRHSSMYGTRQHSTYDQGWVAWFCKQALDQKYKKNFMPFEISGNGKQVRDILYADDMITLYYLIVENIDILNGQAYNVGGGFHNSLSLIELFSYLEEKLDLVLKYKKKLPRYSDQKVFIADMTKIQNRINWKVKVSWQEGIDNVITWLSNNER